MIGDYILTWLDGGAPYRLDFAVTEDVALLFAAALNTDPRYSDVALLKQEIVSSDLSENALLKAGVSTLEAPAE